MSGHQATLLLLLRRSCSSSSSSSFASSSACGRQTPSRRSLLHVVIKQNQQQKRFGTTTTTTTFTRRQNHQQQQQNLSLSRRYFIQSTKIKQTAHQPAAASSSLLQLESLFGNYYYYRHGMMNLHSAYLQHNNNNNDNNKQRILACSATTNINSNSLIHRWLQIFKRWLKSLWHACLVTQRIVEVTIKLSPLMILGPISYYVIPKSQRISDWTWDYTINAVQSIGPVAIKFCQWVATRRDIFPPTLCNKLSVLHDKGCPHSWDYTHQILIDAFGENYEQQGLYIDDNDKKIPIGCGSAAQVYKGRLLLKRRRTKEEGEEGSDDYYHHSSNADVNVNVNDDDSSIVEETIVAIKVLHPNFTQQVERDLELIEIIAGYLHCLPSDMIKMMNLPRVTENFGTVLKLQADLTNEANNLEKFRYNFYHDRDNVEQQSHITFPKPMMKRWQNTNVLVEDFVHDAVPISDYLHDSTPDGLQLRRELAGPLLRAFLKMVFMDNFVHGDLHPGNVLVKTAKVDSGSPKPFWDFWRSSSSSNDIKNVSEEGVEVVKHSIVFLDAGIANSLSPEDKRNLKDLFKAVIFNEGYRAGELMVERAHYERCSTVPGGVDAFARGVGDIVSEFHDRRKEGLTLGAVRIGSLLSRVLDLCRIHGVEIDPHMANVVLSTLVLEGLGRSLAPELDLITFAKPFVLGLGKV